MQAPPAFAYEQDTSNFTCSVCLEPWHDPIELAPCRHILCRACAARLQSCPECRAEISGRQETSRPLVSMVSNLRVSCMDCGWEGSHSQTKTHRCESSSMSLAKMESAVHVAETAAFVETLKSIRPKGNVAVCVKTLPASLPLVSTISSADDNDCTFRMIAFHSAVRVVIGLVDADDRAKFANCMIGRPGLRNSIGLNAAGYVQVDGRTIDRAKKPLQPGDAVTVRLRRGKISFLVNGSDCGLEKLAGLSFEGSFRFAISICECGAAALLGDDAVNDQHRDTVKSLLAAERRRGVPRFNDVLRSINCNGQDTAATCMQNTDATLLTQIPIPRGETFGTQVTIRNIPVGDSAITIGFVDEANYEEFHSCLIGSAGLPNSAGVRVSREGTTILRHGDDPQSVSPSARFVGREHVVKVSLSPELVATYKLGDGTSIEVDMPNSAKLAAVRLAVSLNVEGQAVRIGDLKDDGADEFFLNSAQEISRPAFEDNLKSIDCDPTGHLAMSLKDHPATILCRKRVDCAKDSPLLKTVFHVIHLPATGFRMRFGLTPSGRDDHAGAVLGSERLSGSVGLTSDGKLLAADRGGDENPIAVGLGQLKVGAQVAVVVGGGSVKFEVNGKPVGVPVSISGEFAVGASLPLLGQAVFVGDNPPNGCKEWCTRKLSEAMVTNFNFRDNLRSVDCCSRDKMAVCVRSCPSTSILQSSCVSTATTTVHFTVMACPAGTGVMAVGLIGENKVGPHANATIGSRRLPGSIAYVSNGDVLVDGSTVDQCRGFGADDRISVRLSEGHISFQRNGESISEQLSHLKFSGRFRFGASLPDAGQAVWASHDEDEKPDEAAMKFLESRVSSISERFRDNLRSVDCDNEDRVAVCVNSRASTTRTVLGREPTQFPVCQDFRVVDTAACPEKLAIGLLKADATDSHGSKMLGDGGLRGSIGYYADGTVQRDGEVLEEARNLAAGDVVRVRVTDEATQFIVNPNSDAVSDAATVSVAHEGRACPIVFGASLCARGQIVALGAEVDEDEARKFAEAQLESAGAESEDAPEGAHGLLRWRDDLRSIDCCQQDYAACCVRTRPATLLTQRSILLGVGAHELRCRVETGSDILFGIVDRATGDDHADGLLGQAGLPRSIGFAANGEVRRNGEVLSEHEARRGPHTGGFCAGDVVAVRLTGEKTLEFYVNGALAFSDIAVVAESELSFGVSLRKKGQAVAIIPGDAKSDSIAPASRSWLDMMQAQTDSSDDSDDSDASAAPPAPGAQGFLRWKDQLRSIDCCPQDYAACCVRSHPATLLTQCSTTLGDGATLELHCRVEKLPEGSPAIGFGVVDRETGDEHADTMLGDRRLARSVGFMSDGRLLRAGLLPPEAEEGPHRGGYKQGDVVTIRLTEAQELEFDVNGVAAFTGVKVEAEGRVSFGAALARKSQMVTILSKGREMERPQYHRSTLEFVTMHADGGESEPSDDGFDDVPVGARGFLRWKDQLRSIDCCPQDYAACCVHSTAATVLTQRTVELGCAPEGGHVMSVRIEQLPVLTMMALGVVDCDTGRAHADDILGSKALKRSIGFSSDGRILRGGKKLGNGDAAPGEHTGGYQQGDVVTVRLLADRTLQFEVGGTVAWSGVRVEADGDVAFGASLPSVNQVVAILPGGPQQQPSRYHADTQMWVAERKLRCGESDDSTDEE